MNAYDRQALKGSVIMKRLLCIMLAILLAVAALAGCSKKEENESSSPSSLSPVPEPEASGPYQVGLVQYTDYAPYDEARTAFLSRLEEWGYGDSRMQVDYQKADGDSAKLEEICKSFVDEEKEVVVAISAPAAEAAKKACEGTETKVVFLGVSDPKESLGIEDDVNPEGNITGVADLITARQALDLAVQVDSSIKTVGILYDSNCPFGTGYVDALKAVCAELEIAVVEGNPAGKDQVAEAMKELCGQVDAVFSPMDSTVSAAAQEAAKAAREAGKPWYAASEDAVAAGALASINIDYTDAGNKAADMAVQLVSGKTVEELAVYAYLNGRVSVNQETMDALALPFPEEVLEKANYIKAQKSEET